MLRIAQLVVLTLALGALGACGGGGDDFSDADRAYVEQASASLRQISGTYADLAVCGEDPACIGSAGQPLADAADQEISLVEASAARIDSECLRDSSQQVLRYLRTMKALGLSAAGGDVESVIQAQDQAARLDREVLEGMRACAPDAADASAQFGAAEAIQEVFGEVGTIGQRLVACQDFTCVSDEALALEQTAEAGAARLEEIRSSGALEACAEQVLGTASQALSAYADAGRALQEGDEISAEQAFSEGQQFEAQALRESAC